MDVFDQAARDTAAHHTRVEARAELVASARADSLVELRKISRGLAFIAALRPYTGATDAPPGERGRPIGPSDEELGPPPSARTAAEIPRQPRGGRLLCAAEGYRRRTRP